MATFEAQVEGLTSLTIDGSSSPNQTELTQFLTDGAKEVINLLPSSLLELCASEQSFTSGTPQTLNTGKILYVTRSDGTIYQPCRNIPSVFVGRALDSDDMSAATTTDPIYYVKNNTLDVAPSGANSLYSEVQYPAVTYSDSVVARFPDEAEYLIPLYASVKSLQNLLASKSSNSDITIALTAMNTELDELQNIADSVHTEIGLAKAEAAEIATQTDNSGDFATALTAINTELDKVDEIIIQASEEFDEVSTQTNGSVTSAITLARNAAPSIVSVDDLNINAVFPVSPEINTVSYSEASNSNASAVAVATATATAPNIIDVSANAPEYTKPTFSQTSFSSYTSGLSETDPGALSITAVAPAPPSLSNTSVSFTQTAPVYNKPLVAPDFSQVDTHLDTNEDIELASAKINEIQSQIQEYNSNIQNEQAKFNKENIEYQAKLQIAIKNAEYDNQEDARLLQKYQAEISKYQNNISKEIQEYNNNLNQYTLELNTSLKAWIQTESDKVQKFQLDIQNELNEFNKENAKYQVELKEDVEKSNADLQVAIANANNFAQELRQEAAQSTDVEKFNKSQAQSLNLINASKKMEDLIADNNSKISKYSTELQSYQFQTNKEIQEYQQNLQQKIQEFDSSMKLQQSYLSEAQAGISSGNSYLQKAQATISQANAYASEINSRATFTGAKTQAVQSYINTAQSYIAEMQSKVTISQGYGNEIQMRLGVDTAQYSWYEKQQAKLQADYDKGLQIIIQKRN